MALKDKMLWNLGNFIVDPGTYVSCYYTHRLIRKSCCSLHFSPAVLIDDGRLHLLTLLKAAPVASESQPKIVVYFLACTFHSLKLIYCVESSVGGFFGFVWFCIGIKKKDCIFSSHSRTHINPSQVALRWKNTQNSALKWVKCPKSFLRSNFCGITWHIQKIWCWAAAWKLYWHFPDVFFTAGYERCTVLQRCIDTGLCAVCKSGESYLRGGEVVAVAPCPSVTNCWLSLSFYLSDALRNRTYICGSGFSFERA